MHARVVALVRELVVDDAVIGAHDVADGGLALCVAEMAVHSSCGVEVPGVGDVASAFDETPSRVVVSVTASEVDALERRCRAAGVPFAWIGTATGDRVRIGDVVDLPLAAVVDRWRDRLPVAFGTAVTH